MTNSIQESSIAVGTKQMASSHYARHTLFPERDAKMKIASSLAALKVIVEECSHLKRVPSAAQFNRLFSTYESMVTDDSHYSLIMKELLRLFKLGVFVGSESRLESIHEILGIKNSELSSMMFQEAGLGTLTHLECLQRVLTQYKETCSVNRNEVSNLNFTINSSQL